MDNIISQTQEEDNQIIDLQCQRYGEQRGKQIELQSKSEREQQQEAIQKSICGIAAQQFYLFKQPSIETEILLIGDILIELQLRVDNDDIDYLIKKALLLQDKKCIDAIYYSKDKHLIHVINDNKYRGVSDFGLVYQRLVSHQSGQLKIVAEELNRFWYYALDSEAQYSTLVQETGYLNLLEQQQNFFHEMTQQFLNNPEKEDVFAYFGISYLNKSELGIPLNVQYGLSEGICAILGCTPNQMIEIIGKTSHISFFLSRDIMPGMIINVCQLMQLMYTFQTAQDVQTWESPSNLLTLDGIFVSFTVKVTQFIKRVNGLPISIFYTSEFIFDHKTISRMLSIRSNPSNFFNSRNILDLLISDNLQNNDAINFFNFISNHQNFKPPCQQDLYPHKTCKIKTIQTNHHTNNNVY